MNRSIYITILNGLLVGLLIVSLLPTCLPRSRTNLFQYELYMYSVQLPFVAVSKSENVSFTATVTCDRPHKFHHHSSNHNPYPVVPESLQVVQSLYCHRQFSAEFKPYTGSLDHHWQGHHIWPTVLGNWWPILRGDGRIWSFLGSNLDLYFVSICYTQS